MENEWVIITMISVTLVSTLLTNIKDILKMVRRSQCCGNTIEMQQDNPVKSHEDTVNKSQ